MNENTQVDYNGYNNQNAQQYYARQNYPDNYDSEPPVSVGSWMLIMLGFCIPIVNIILFIVFACGGHSSKSVVNYCRAGLLFAIIVIALYIAVAALIFSSSRYY